MGFFNEFSFPVRAFLKVYPWRRIDPVPWIKLSRPLNQCKVALVSSAGFVLPDQKPFDDTIKGGDWSFREIPSTSLVSELRDAHRSESFDHQGMLADPNLVFPLDRFRELKARGRIGDFNPRSFSFMGSITAPGRLIKETAPRAAQLLVEDKVHAVLLVPV